MESKAGDRLPFATPDRVSRMNQLNTEPGTFPLRVVESDMIYAVGYAESNQTLVLLSNQGKIYRYFAVPRDVYEKLLASNSVDRYLQEFILGCYACIQVKRRGRKRHR